MFRVLLHPRQIGHFHAKLRKVNTKSTIIIIVEGNERFTGVRW